MYDVSNKEEIMHRATSQAVIRVYPETLEKIKNNKSFEVNLVESAKMAGALAAKKSWEIIPYSHQKTIDHVKVEFSFRSELIEIVVEVKGISKSSLSIESLTAVSAAAIAVYDRLRLIDDSVLIESIRQLREADIISESKEKRRKKVRGAVLVIGDSEFIKDKADEIEKFTVDKIGNDYFEVTESHIIGIEQNTIESNLKKLCDETKAELIVTCGGIDLKSGNIASSITEKILDSKIEGIPEMLRAYGVKRIPSTILYGGVAGIRGKSIIINLSANIKEISGSLEILLPYILHVNKIVERN